MLEVLPVVAVLEVINLEEVEYCTSYLAAPVTSFHLTVAWVFLEDFKLLKVTFASLVETLTALE